MLDRTASKKRVVPQPSFQQRQLQVRSQVLVLRGFAPVVRLTTYSAATLRKRAERQRQARGAILLTIEADHYRFVEALVRSTRLTGDETRSHAALETEAGEILARWIAEWIGG